MAGDFEVLEHTADIGIVAHGATLAEAFANAGRGLFSLITELDTVRQQTARQVSLRADDAGSLLVKWLNELIFLFDTEHLLFSRFTIDQIDDHELKGVCFGEPVDTARHRIKLGVKAATYHLLAVDKRDGYRLRVIFDI